MLENTAPQWGTVKQLSQLEPSFSEHALRWHIFQGKQNGLEPHIRRIGRKVLINVTGFRQWIANQA